MFWNSENSEDCELEFWFLMSFFVIREINEQKNNTIFYTYVASAYITCMLISCPVVLFKH